MWRTRLAALVRGFSSRVTVRWGDFWHADLGQADVVFIYGYSTIMARLEAKLRRELKVGACVVSYRYQLPTWKPEAAHEGVYRYRCPG